MNKSFPYVNPASCSLSGILLTELLRFQPYTNCRKVVERIIEQAWDAGLLESLSPFSAADPKFQRLTNKNNDR